MNRKNESSQAGETPFRVEPPAAGPTFSARIQAEADTQRLIQELQLHKIELEMQNEELLRIQEDLRASWKQIDHQVVERTAELSRAVEHLSAEVKLRFQAETALRAANAELAALKGRRGGAGAAGLKARYGRKFKASRAGLRRPE